MSFGLLRSWLNRPAPANRRPRKSARPPVAIEQLEERQLLATALTAPLLFDFGTDTSPVADGAVGVPLVKYSSARGYGWKSLPGLTAVDRLTSDPLTCDFHRGRNGTFVVDLPNGSYQVTAILGDPFSLLDRVNLTVEGQMVAARLFANVGGTVRATFQADVTDGRLDLQIADKGGSNPYFSLAALNISPNLTANAGGDQSAIEGQAVSFSGSVSGVSTTGLSYLWNFGDGSTATGTLTPSHTYRDNGTYKVTLYVSDATGATAHDTVMVTVDNAAPVAELGGPYEVAVSTPLTIDPLISDPGAQDELVGFTFAWNFGDGSTASGDPGTHAWATPGTYTVQLRVTDKDGAATTASTTVTVKGAAAPVVSAGPDRTAAEGQAVSFSGSVSGVSTTGLSYLWNFGDGSTATGTLTPSHTYRDNGTYKVT
ncbi:MAG TPA: PKD domain-containing protein, partial [Gemmataceae bacterium]|nr:PKD domain-containing protein [Gemmataceae bacterium]